MKDFISLLIGKTFQAILIGCVAGGLTWGYFSITSNAQDVEPGGIPNYSALLKINESVNTHYY